MTGKSIITVIGSSFKDVNGELVSCFAIDGQFSESNPVNIRVEIYLDIMHGEPSGLEILKHLPVMLQPHIIGGTHVPA